MEVRFAEETVLQLAVVDSAGFLGPKWVRMREEDVARLRGVAIGVRVEPIRTYRLSAPPRFKLARSPGLWLCRGPRLCERGRRPIEGAKVIAIKDWLNRTGCEASSDAAGCVRLDFWCTSRYSRAAVYHPSEGDVLGRLRPERCDNRPADATTGEHRVRLRRPAVPLPCPNHLAGRRRRCAGGRRGLRHRPCTLTLTVAGGRNEVTGESKHDFQDQRLGPRHSCCRNHIRASLCRLGTRARCGALQLSDLWV